ncbi:MAG: hypothetical protein JWQ05_1622, partial [Methylobacterium sp.]|nr:hypothetical protein [Methylobacterium sp.]
YERTLRNNGIELAMLSVSAGHS